MMDRTNGDSFLGTVYKWLELHSTILIPMAAKKNRRKRSGTEARAEAQTQQLRGTLAEML
jgi:hypothetical protein